MNQETPPTETQAEPPEEKSGRATYSPEDNKIRLYVGRVPREEFLKLRADGWITLHKQREAGGGDFAATWSPSRLATALEYADLLEDEDAGPEERAADRAERFGGYRDKRTDEATGHADRYDAQPSAHGYQNAHRAERAAARHDRIGDRAGDAWSKAEYWQRRTAGVIAHALYKSSPGVRMGRIKTIEADLRRVEKQRTENATRFETWRKIAAMTDPEKQNKLAEAYAGMGYGRDGYTHPRTGANGSLWDFMRPEAADRLTGAEAAAVYIAEHTDPTGPEWEQTGLAVWANHYKLRLAYENQMIEAQGGRAAFVEMVAGGWIGKHQIRKVNKSNETGRVVSVTLKCEGNRYGSSNEGYHLRAFNIERLHVDAYRPPTPEDLAELAATKKTEKAAQPVKAACPLVNPTDADAERLQALWNAQAQAEHEAGNTYGSPEARALHTSQFKPAEVTRITQAVYSANSSGACSRAETRGLHGSAELSNAYSDMWSRARDERATRIGPAVCKVRITSGGKSRGWAFESLIILTDKPQKPLPSAVWEKYTPKPEPVAEAVPVAEPAPLHKSWACACGFTAETSAVYDAKLCPDCGSGMFSARELAATV